MILPAKAESTSFDRKRQFLSFLNKTRLAIVLFSIHGHDTATAILRNTRVQEGIGRWTFVHRSQKT